MTSTMKTTAAAKAPPTIAQPFGDRRLTRSITDPIGRSQLDLNLEQGGLCGDRLVLDLGGDIHGQRRVLHGGDGGRRIADRARGQALSSGRCGVLGLSSPLIALESAEPKLAEPVFAGWETDEADPIDPIEPTEAADPSADTLERAGII